MKSLLQKNGCITSTDPVVTSSNKACSTISPTRKPKSRASSSIPTQLII